MKMLKVTTRTKTYFINLSRVAALSKEPDGATQLVFSFNDAGDYLFIKEKFDDVLAEMEAADIVNVTMPRELP